MKPYSTVNDWVQELDIADGLKQLLTDADFTIDSIIGLGYQEISETLHIDPYVGKLIVEAALDIVLLKKPQPRYIRTMVMVACESCDSVKPQMLMLMLK
jgi:hypothetical protein